MKTPLLATTLVQGDRIRSFEVRPVFRAGTGWEASEGIDTSVTVRLYTDWHRVEQVLLNFSRKIEELRGQGWRDCGPGSTHKSQGLAPAGHLPTGARGREDHW